MMHTQTKSSTKAIFLLILSLLFFQFFIYGYHSYIIHLLYDTGIESTFVVEAEAMIYAKTHSIPYFLFLFLSTLAFIGFVKNNSTSVGLLLAACLFAFMAVYQVDLLLLHVLTPDIQINEQRSYVWIQSLPYVFLFIFSLVLLTAFMRFGTQSKPRIKTLNKPLNSKRIGSNQLKNFLLFVIVLMLTIIAITLFSNLTENKRHLMLLAFAQKDFETLFTNLRMQWLPELNGRIVYLLALSLLSNAIFFFCYIYFQRSLAYFFSIIAAFALLLTLPVVHEHGFVLSFIVSSAVIGVFMYGVSDFIKTELKKKITAIIKAKFDSLRQTWAFIIVLELPLLIFPYAMVSGLFIFSYYVIVGLPLVIVFQVIITFGIGYFYLYQQYQKGELFFDYDPF